MSRRFLMFKGVILLIVVSLSSCLSFAKTRCAGCTHDQAYSDPQALALVGAAVRGDAKEVERLVKAGANPNHLEEGTVPMLIWTMCAKNKDGYEALLRAGADPNLGGSGSGLADYGITGGPFMRNDRSHINKGWSAMVMAAAIEDPFYLKLAIQYGGDLNGRRGERGDRPLVIAAHEGLMENVRILLDAGADVNVHDEQFEGYDAFYAATNTYARYDIALLLLERGYNYDLKRVFFHRHRPLHPAMVPYRDRIYEILKERGIDDGR